MSATVKAMPARNTYDQFFIDDDSYMDIRSDDDVDDEVDSDDIARL